jgi:plastocyanin
LLAEKISLTKEGCMKKLIFVTISIGLIVLLLSACGTNSGNEQADSAAAETANETENTVPAIESEPTEEPLPTEEPEPTPESEPTQAPTLTPEPTAEPTEEPTTEPEPTLEPEEVIIDMLDFEFSEITTTIPAGTTITWDNVGEFQHSATDVNGEWDTGLYDPGLMESITFDTPGTFPYYCILHGAPDGSTGMVGTIIVTEE